MGLTKAGLVQPQGLSTVERNLLTLAGLDSGRLIYNETTGVLQQWTGTQWIDVLSTASSLNGANLTGVVSGALIDALDGSKLTGVVSGALVDSLDGSKLTGVVSDTLITQLGGDKLFGVVDGGVY